MIVTDLHLHEADLFTGTDPDTDNFSITPRDLEEIDSLGEIGGEVSKVGNALRDAISSVIDI